MKTAGKWGLIAAAVAIATLAAVWTLDSSPFDPGIPRVYAWCGLDGSLDLSQAKVAYGLAHEHDDGILFVDALTEPNVWVRVEETLHAGHDVVSIVISKPRQKPARKVLKGVGAPEDIMDAFQCVNIHPFGDVTHVRLPIEWQIRWKLPQKIDFKSAT